VSELSDARDEIKLELQTSVDPVVTDDEVDTILAQTIRASVWAASTSYTLGKIVLPTTRTGRGYQVIVPGTSGSTEPTWPTTQMGQVSEGSSSPQLTWEEAGLVSSIYDKRAAKRQICLVKANRCSDRVNFSADGRNISAHQTPQYWLEMAKQYVSVGVS
jgi:hypothetical protein